MISAPTATGDITAVAPFVTVALRQTIPNYSAGDARCAVGEGTSRTHLGTFIPYQCAGKMSIGQFLIFVSENF